jgi:hypothetical protein
MSWSAQSENVSAARRHHSLADGVKHDIHESFSRTNSQCSELEVLPLSRGTAYDVARSMNSQGDVDVTG